MSVDITIQETVNEVDITVNQNVITVNVTRTTGSGGVTSVNGDTGDVVLTTDNVAEGSTNLYFTVARVRATILTGISFVSGAVITATDTVLSALGKLQKQVSSIDLPYVLKISDRIYQEPVPQSGTTYTFEIDDRFKDLSLQGGGNEYLLNDDADLFPINSVIMFHIYDTPALLNYTAGTDLRYLGTNASADIPIEVGDDCRLKKIGSGSIWELVISNKSTGDRVFQEISGSSYTFEIDDRWKDTLISGTTNLILDDDADLFPINSVIPFHVYDTDAVLNYTAGTDLRYLGASASADIPIEVGDDCRLKKISTGVVIWELIISNKSTGGGITAVDGTANEITASGTTTRTIGIDSAYTAARNAYADTKVENNITSSTTVAPSKTAVKTEYDMITGLTFSGAFALDKKGGRSYLPYTQTGSLTLSIGGSPIVGGFAVLRFTANGSAISGYSGWKLLSSDGITATNGVVHRVIVYQYEDEIWYSVKLN